jgi:hypothetical protein
MNVAAHSTTLLSFATILTIATGVFSLAFVITTWLFLGRKERHMRSDRPLPEAREAPSVSDQSERRLAESDPAPPGQAINLRETVRQAVDVDEDLDVGGGAKVVGRWVLIFLLTVAPLVGVTIFWLATH